jgi:hypothetical protein
MGSHPFKKQGIYDIQVSKVLIRKAGKPYATGLRQTPSPVHACGSFGAIPADIVQLSCNTSVWQHTWGFGAQHKTQLTTNQHLYF